MVMGLEGESYKLSDDGLTYSWVTDGPLGRHNQTTILESATLMGQMALDPVLIPDLQCGAIRIRMKASLGNSAVAIE